MKGETIIIGLTGGIATGKSTVARMLHARGAEIFDADKVAHQLLQPDQGAFAAVAALFPSAVHEGKIHRPTLGALVFNQPQQLAKLEGILHPLVRQAEQDFLSECKQRGVKFAVLEIPLLFETGSDAMCDVTVTTECLPDIQRERALLRPNMSKEKFDHIVSLQMKQDERRQRADWVIPTGMSEQETEQAVASLLRVLEP